ncbi:hypothetical protein HanHA300_Chr04g0156421 [Helianthus annuus]|nr:hypothetical protein HanHA300_Chr04g0156421 [Helianthus annuus]KAJ0598816.1 hypothetical protein HanHA89_Chr04g0169841 [Helianthus annuus]
MNWVDDDPCECCGSGEHYLEDCSVFYEKVQANKEREDYLSGLFEYRRVDYEDFNGPSSYYPYDNPPLPHYQEYYYEPESPHFSSYREEEYDDYYNEYPQPALEEPLESMHSKLDSLINMMKEYHEDIKEYHEDIKEIKKANEVRDKAHEVLAMQVGQLVKEMAQLKRDQEDLAKGTRVDGDVVEEVIELQEQENDCLNQEEDITPRDGSEPKEADVHIDPSPILITPTNKVGDEGSGIRIRRVVLQDIGRFGKKRPKLFNTHAV